MSAATTTSHDTVRRPRVKSVRETDVRAALGNLRELLQAEAEFSLLIMVPFKGGRSKVKSVKEKDVVAALIGKSRAHEATRGGVLGCWSSVNTAAGRTTVVKSCGSR